MNGDGGIYYLDGFSVEKENGLTSLDENYRASELVNSSTANYENIDNIMSMLYVYPLNGSTITAAEGYTLMMNSSSRFFLYDLFSSGYRGEIGGIPASGSYIFTQRPDMSILPSGNIIYSSGNHLGLMVRGLCKTGSSTTKIIDTAGRDFTTLGLSSSSPNNKVTNIKTGAQYTITSVSTTTATNDTLNFSAGTANSENDEFIAYVNTKWDLMSGVTHPQFIGQPITAYWSRPIRKYGDEWFIANGNWIAKLASDESTIAQNFKHLPSGYQCETIEVNGSDILVSAIDNLGVSHIMMWDGFSDGWNTDVVVSRAPSSLKAYGTGWVYLADSAIYYTDGRNIQKLISFPDNRNLGSKGNPPASNGIAIIDDIMYFAVSNNNANRGQRGVLVFNAKTGLSFFKTRLAGKAFNTVNCIYLKSNARIDGRYSTSNDIELGCDSSYCNLNDFTSSSLPTENKSFVYFVDFQEETQVGQIWLNLKKTSKVVSAYGKQCQITVSVGNGNRGIIELGQLATVPTTTTATNTLGATYPLSVGDEIEFVSGDLSGQRTFVTGVTNGGTSSEVITFSPAVSTTMARSSDIRIWKYQKSETKVIQDTELSKPAMFNINFLGSKMYLEVLVTGITNSFPISINDILIF